MGKIKPCLNVDKLPFIGDFPLFSAVIYKLVSAFMVIKIQAI